MTKEELIKILEEYEVFVDDDYGGSYQNIIAYTKDKKISNAFTSLGALKIINTFEKMQKEKKELIDYLKKEINKIHKEIEHYDIWHEVGTDINFLILKKQFNIEILSKYKEIIGGSNENRRN